MPLRYAKDAVAKANQLISAQKALVKEHLGLWQRRKKKTTERINKIAKKDPNSRKLHGLHRKLEKQQRKVTFYQQHLDADTFPPVIFESRELYLAQFKEGANKESWRKQWKDSRNGRLSARGDRAKKGNPLSFVNFRENQLYDARSGRRDWLIGNITRKIVAYVKERGAGLVMEDLKFINDRDVSHKFNRMAHQFTYRHLATSVEREALRQGVELRKVHPAYISVIGRLKYQPQSGISVHSSAALVIARRGALKIRREMYPRRYASGC